MRAQGEGIRIGVVGVGYWGSKHVGVLQAAIEAFFAANPDQ